MDIIATILLWLLGVVFVASGAAKLFIPVDRLATQHNMEWVERVDPTRLRIAGATELAAGLTFVLTVLDVGFLGDNPWLAGIAAVGIVCQMAVAAIQVHQPVGESTVPNTALAMLAALLAIVLFLG